MATDDEGFEQWVADEGGPEAVTKMVADLRLDVEAGRLPSFTDKDQFLAYIQSHDRRSAGRGKSSSAVRRRLTSSAWI